MVPWSHHGGREGSPEGRTVHRVQSRAWHHRWRRPNDSKTAILVRGPGGPVSIAERTHQNKRCFVALGCVGCARAKKHPGGLVCRDRTSDAESAALHRGPQGRSDAEARTRRPRKGPAAGPVLPRSPQRGRRGREGCRGEAPARQKGRATQVHETGWLFAVHGYDSVSGAAAQAP